MCSRQRSCHGESGQKFLTLCSVIMLQDTKKVGKMIFVIKISFYNEVIYYNNVGKYVKEFKRVPTAPSVPRRSPIQVLTGPNIA